MLLPRKASLFMREDSVVRESQQGMLRVKTQGLIMSGKWHDRMCAVQDGRLCIWTNYEAFVHQKVKK
jgi:hypothetical protein